MFKIKYNINTLYIVIHIISNKCYIGYTSQEINGYWKKHIYNAKIEKHNGKSKRPFYNALNKYGSDNFEWSIISAFDTIEEVKQAEIYWIDRLKEFGIELYNRTIGGDGAAGYIQSQDQKNKKRESMIGEKNHFHGKSHSEETIKKISETKKGNNLSPSTIKNMSLTRKGELNKNSKLTNNDVLKIRELLKTDINQVEISNIFNVSNSTISYIKLNKSWKI